jgi:SNF2 family DNA or RNA helicase
LKYQEQLKETTDNDTAPKLQKTKSTISEDVEVNDSGQESPAILDYDPEQLPSVDELKWAKDILDSRGDDRPKLKSSEHSNKVCLALNIVREAMKLKDNVLIFFHSIPTLEFVEAKLKRKHYHVYKLTGSTPMAERQGMIDEFNNDTTVIFLISSKVHWSSGSC